MASGDAAKRAKLEAAIAALDAQDWDAASADFADDFVQEWPQSGERLSGKEHCLTVWRNYPGGGPTMKVRRISGAGDEWIVETTLDYSGKPVLGVHIFEFRGDKIVRETDYWADPFQAPDWRKEWVTVDANMAGVAG
jgi:hypothetical protein